MWISKRRWSWLNSEVESLERQITALRYERVKVGVTDDGLLFQSNHSSEVVDLVDAINLLAQSSGFRWKFVYSQPHKIVQAAAYKPR